MLAGGWPVRQVSVVVGPTGCGKSELLRQCAAHTAEGGDLAITADYELGAERIAERYLSQQSRVAARRLRDDDLHPGEPEQIDRARRDLADNEHLLTLNPGTGAPVGDVLAALDATLKERAGDNPALVIVDSLQRFAAGAPNDQQRLQVQGAMWALERFAHDHGAAVVVIAEQRRLSNAAKGEPMIGSAAESRAIEFVADALLVLSQPEPGAKDGSSWDRIVSVSVEKNRLGETGPLPVDLVFSGPCWAMRTEVRPDAHADLDQHISETIADGEIWSTERIRDQVGGRATKVRQRLRTMEGTGAIEHVMDGNRAAGWMNKEAVPTRDRLAVPNSGPPGTASPENSANSLLSLDKEAVPTRDRLGLPGRPSRFPSVTRDGGGPLAEPSPELPLPPPKPIPISGRG